MFRLKGYLKPFRLRDSHQFKPDSTFEDVMYRWLRAGHSRRMVASFYGLSDTVFESWLHTLVYTRNICAHHSRLWNRHLRINAVVPRRTRLPFIDTPNDTKKIYYVLSIILYLLQTINSNNTFVSRFKLLLSEYPQVDVAAMGFPESTKGLRRGLSFHAFSWFNMSLSISVRIVFVRNCTFFIRITCSFATFL